MIDTLKDNVEQGQNLYQVELAVIAKINTVCVLLLITKKKIFNCLISTKK